MTDGTKRRGGKFKVLEKNKNKITKQKRTGVNKIFCSYIKSQKKCETYTTIVEYRIKQLAMDKNE